jgi:hypothetical protein
MPGIFHRLFGRQAPRETERSTGRAEPEIRPCASARFTECPDGPRGTAAGDEGDTGRLEYEEFSALFCHQPGRNFMELLRSKQVSAIEAWLHWTRSPPEAKAFIRLMLEMRRRDQEIWQQPGISIFVDDWCQRGEGSGESAAALSVLAQILEQPIKLYYQENPDTPMMVLRFDP